MTKTFCDRCDDPVDRPDGKMAIMHDSTTVWTGDLCHRCRIQLRDFVKPLPKELAACGLATPETE